MSEKDSLLELMQESEDDAVTFDVSPVWDGSSIEDIQRKLNENERKLDATDAKIDNLTNKADLLDYGVAAASGIVSGFVDTFFVGEFSLKNAQKWGTKKVEEKVMRAARKRNPNVKDLADAVSEMEKVKAPGDWVASDFGGGDHHFYDFTHHKSPIGLISSLIAQFTGNVFGIDPKTGFVEHRSIEKFSFDLKGRTPAGKIACGIVNWSLHLVSDMVGTRGTVLKGNYGTGIPGPIVSTLSEFASLPIFKSKDGVNRFSQWLYKLFSGEVVDGYRFDYRMEVGLAHEVGKLSTPVLINECIVRVFYFIRRFIAILKEEDVRSFRQLKADMFKRALPFKNRTLTRMLTISTGVMTTIDLADAAIRSGGNWAGFAIHINYVGVARFAVAACYDGACEIKKRLSEKEKAELISERCLLLNAKVSAKNRDVWVEVNNTEESIKEVEKLVNGSMKLISGFHKEIREDVNDIGDSLDEMKKSNSDTLKKMKEVLD